MSIKKRITVVLVLLSLFLQQAMAIGLDSVLDGTSVSTSFGKWDSPRTGSRYFYGGSYAFAFKHSGIYQPFFQGEPPSAKIGCNAFSLSGGFIALLGIDEIKVMLKNAGATLAWGLMMGLQYSMPALARVFATLRKWAREIQAILQNACNLGKVLMKNHPALKGIRETISNSYVGKADEWMKDNLEGNMGGIDKFINTGYQYATNGCAGLQNDALKTCKNKTGGVIRGITRRVVVSSQNSFLNQAAGSHVKTATVPTNTLSISKLSTFLNTGKIQKQTIFSTGSELDTYKTNVILSRLFFGDKTTLLKSLKKIIMMADNSSQSIAEKVYKIEPTKIKPFLKAKLTEQITLSSGEGEGMIIPPKLTSAENAAKAILYGIKEGSCKKNCHDGYVDILDNYVYALDFAEDAKSKDYSRVLGNVLYSAQDTPPTLRVNWNGAFVESLQVIRSIVKQKSGYNPTYKTIEEGSVGMKSPSATNIKVPLLLPNINKYIDTIVLLEKKSKKETAFTAQLKDILAKNNAYFFSTSLMDLIAGSVVSAIGSNGDAAGRPKTKEILDYLKFVTDTKNDISKKIREDRKNQISYRELTETFEKIDKNLRKENMKGY